MSASLTGLTLVGVTPFVALQSAKAQTVNSYKISVVSYFVEKDQRRPNRNWEGLLELRGLFSVNNQGVTILPAPNSYQTAGQGQTINLNRQLSTITTTSSSLEIPIKAQFEEIEKGFGGGDDFGEATGSITLDGSSEVTTTVRVSIPGDTTFEREATVVVTFKAEKI